MNENKQIHLTHDELDELSFDDYDEAINPRPDCNEFDIIVELALSRRDFMKGIMVFGSAATLGLTTTALTSVSAKASSNRFGFKAVAASTKDTVVVPEGFSWHVVARWGDPLFSNAPEFNHATRGSAASQARAFGDNNDGMAIFTDKDGRQILVANNEYTTRSVMWGNNRKGKYASDDDINKGKNAHGLTVVELKQINSQWKIVKDSTYNRRITPDEPMDITGPARSHDMMKTHADPEGVTVLGTFNNCGNGQTPWGTYLTCEENFNGYFGTSKPKSYEQDSAKKRYGISGQDRGYGWWKVDDRFDVAKNPNESNRHGYITEVDPYNPTSKPKKRTALGRFKHENAELVINSDGRIAIYMGDDERGEFLYKYLSDSIYIEGEDTNDLMENGTLYAAKFDSDGAGKWLELTPDTTGMDKPTICINTRMGGDEMTVGGPNPRKANRYGQIVRWRPTNADHSTNSFTWDLYVMAGNPTVHNGVNAGSKNITEGNMFNSPDGLSFDDKGLLWIQTDGNYSNKKHYAGQGNNQMLVGDPASGEIRRFLVGPRQAEITGIAWSTDRKTIFVGIQHPGEQGDSNWPDGGDKTPRSSIVAIQRDDGDTIG